jgi:hypothetical protein
MFLREGRGLPDYRRQAPGSRGRGLRRRVARPYAGQALVPYFFPGPQSTCPGAAPVIFPPSTTSTPLTATNGKPEL